MADPEREGVRIVDVDMPFGSMVRFMVKWAIAAIPALIILMVIGAVVAALLAGVTAGFARRALDLPSTASGSSGASILDSLRRVSQPTSSPDPEWRVSESTNPLDDSPMVTLSLDASGPSPSGFRSTPTLIVRCRSKETDLYVNWDAYVGLDESTVTTRIGRAPATKKAWSISTDNKATFYPGSPVTFIKELLAADTLIAATTPYNESPVTAVFRLTGLAEKIQPLRTACKW